MSARVEPAFENLLDRIRACTHCARHLPEGPRPILQASATSRIAIIGQAPGRRVHVSGVPWQDDSGDHLRDWLEMPEAVFYDARQVALVPMGFCYPGSRSGGDAPPRPECAPLWHEALLSAMGALRLTLLVGRYAQVRYLGADFPGTITEAVQRGAPPDSAFFCLPHPSWRSRIWMRKNPWFERETLPRLRAAVRTVLA